MATNYDKFEYDLLQAGSLDDYFKNLDAGKNLLLIGGIQLDDLPAVKIGTPEAKDVREILKNLPFMLRNIKNSYLTVDLMPSGIAYDNTSLNNVLLIKLDIVTWFNLLYNTAKREDLVTSMAELAKARDKTEELNEKLTNYENKATNDALRDADEQLDNADNSTESSEAPDKLENAHLGEENHNEDEQAKDNDASDSDQDSASNDTPSDDNTPKSDNNAENQTNNENDENQDDTVNSDTKNSDDLNDLPTLDDVTESDDEHQDNTANSDTKNSDDLNDLPTLDDATESDDENQDDTANSDTKNADDLNDLPTLDDATESDDENQDDSQNTDSTNNTDGTDDLLNSVENNTDGDNASSELDELEKESLPHNVTNRPFSAEVQAKMAKQDDKLQQVKTASENAKANINPESQANIPSVKMQTPPVQVTNSTGQDTQTQLLTKMMETLNLVLKRETKKDEEKQEPKAVSKLTPKERLAKFRSKQDQLIASMIAKQI